MIQKVYNVANEETVLQNIAKLRPLNYNRFMWWRKFEPKNKPLPPKSLLLDKIQNGDFEFSHYWWQAKFAEIEINKAYIECGFDMQKLLENHAVDLARRKRLWEDFEKDEANKLEYIRKEFTKEFRMTKEDYNSEVLEFGGTLKELYHHCTIVYGKKLRSIKQRGRPRKI